MIDPNLSEEDKKDWHACLRAAGYKGDPSTHVKEMPLEDFMRFQIAWMWTMLRDEGESHTHAMVIGVDSDLTMINLHFLEPKLIPLALLSHIHKNKCTRAVLVSEVWTATDNRTDREIRAGVTMRQPRDREDRTECLYAVGWEWGRERELCLVWPIERSTDGKAVMKGEPTVITPYNTPLTAIAVAMWEIANSRTGKPS